ncbi:MAG: glyoxalase superfamily protein [Hyphomonas sp.]
MTEWFTRPVFHVADVQRSIDFYVERLGFEESWRHTESGTLLVAQVEREGCVIILSCQWSENNGTGLVFISADQDAESVRADLERRGAPVKEGWWGYRLFTTEDPDGNRLFFNYPDAQAGSAGES